MTKKTDEPGPLVPQVSARGGFRAVMRTALKKAPVLSVLTEYIENVEHERESERREKWTAHIHGETDPAEFAKWLERVLESAEAEYVRAAIFESVRAATEALDAAIVPPIAKLTNRYLTTRTPERRMFRAILAMLRSVDADEFGALTVAWHRMRALDQNPANPVDTTITLEHPPDGSHVWRWRCCGVRPEVDLVVGELAPRVVAAFMPLSVDEFAIYAKTGTSRERPQFALEVVALLCDIAPLPGT